MFSLLYICDTPNINILQISIPGAHCPGPLSRPAGACNTYRLFCPFCPAPGARGIYCNYTAKSNHQSNWSYNHYRMQALCKTIFSLHVGTTSVMPTGTLCCLLTTTP